MSTTEARRKFRAGEIADLGRAAGTNFGVRILVEHSEEYRETKLLRVSAEELEAIIRVLLAREGQES